jgi:hypothetical protein
MEREIVRFIIEVNISILSRKADRWYLKVGENILIRCKISQKGIKILFPFLHFVKCCRVYISKIGLVAKYKKLVSFNIFMEPNDFKVIIEGLEFGN